MTRPAADRVRVEWAGVGTGTMSLGSAVPGFQAFPAALNGLHVSYVIEHQTSTEAEAGFGVYSSSGNTLSRIYRTYPTLGGSAVNFSSGTKHVRLTQTQVDASPNITATNPTINDDISVGYLEGRSTWLNTATNAFFVLTDHAAGAAVWSGVGVAAAVQSVNAQTGAVVLTGTHISAGYTPSNYDPAGSNLLISEHLQGIDEALTGGADASPTQVLSNAAEYVLTLGSALHNNAEVRSHQATVDFEVPTSAAAGVKWLVKPVHDGCIVSVDTNVGSINGTVGGSARIINGGIAYVEVDSNAGSAPIVQVRGNVILAPSDIGTTKTYTNDDSDREFRLTSTSTQTFSASSNYLAGFEVILYRETTGTITIDGADADYTISGPDIVNVVKVGTAILALGKAGIVVLDAA
jgi:hypothetical protein